MKIRLAPSVIGTVRNYIRNSVCIIIERCASVAANQYVNDRIFVEVNSVLRSAINTPVCNHLQKK